MSPFSGFRSFALAIAYCVAFAGFSSAQTVKQTAKKTEPAAVVSKMENEGKYEAKEDKGLKFSVLGDWGWNGKKNQTEVARVMAAKGVGGFIVSVGDNFQVNGVRSVTDPLWMLNYENVYVDPTFECDWYVALGNHDYHGEVQAEIDYSKISRRWNMPGRYFAVHKKINDTTAVDFYIIDTSPFQSEYYKSDEFHVAGQDTARQMRWIDSCLTNSKSRWKLVFGHHPVYSSGSAHGKETAEMEARFAGFFDKKGVDAYFCGHDHNFEYLKPQGSRVNYFVCGTVEVRPMGELLPSSKFAKSVPGYTKVRLNRAEMVVTMIDTAGKEIYNTKIEK
jgi:tartrate-resistant acid phosphatase type 5